MPGDLDEHVTQIRGAIADVREDRQHEEEQHTVEGHGETAPRPVDDEVDQDDEPQHDVVDDPAGLPVRDGVRHDVADLEASVCPVYQAPTESVATTCAQAHTDGGWPSAVD